MIISVSNDSCFAIRGNVNTIRIVEPGISTRPFRVPTIAIRTHGRGHFGCCTTGRHHLHTRPMIPPHTRAASHIAADGDGAGFAGQTGAHRYCSHTVT